MGAKCETTGNERPSCFLLAKQRRNSGSKKKKKKRKQPSRLKEASSMVGGEWPYQLQLPEKGKRYVQNDADTCRCSVKKKRKKEKYILSCM